MQKKRKRARNENRILTFAQAARLAGLTAGGITRAVQGRRLVPTANGRGIDPDHPKNAAYFESHVAVRSKAAAAKRASVSPGRASALMAKLRASYALRKERVSRHLEGYLFADMVDAGEETFMRELRKRMERIPGMLTPQALEDYMATDRWVGKHAGAAITGAKDAARRALLRMSDDGGQENELPEIGMDSTYDEVKAALNLVDAYRDDLRRAIISRALIPKEKADQRIAMLGGSVNTFILTLPKRMGAELPSRATSQGLEAARSTLAHDIKDALSRVGRE